MPSPWPAEARRTLLPYVSFVLTGMINTIFGPLLPWLTARFALSDAEAGLLFTLELTASVAAGIVSGLAVARFGFRRTAGAGAVCSMLGVAGLALPSRSAVAAAGCLAGIGIGLIIPSMNLLVSKSSRGRSAAAVSGLNVAWSAGAMVWPLVVAIGAERALAALAIALLLAAAWCFRGNGDSGGGRASAAPPLPQVTGLGGAALFGWLFVVYVGVETGVGGWLTQYTARAGAAASGTFVLLPAAGFWGGGMVGRVIAAWRLTDASESAVTLGGCALACIGIGALLIARQPDIMLLTAIVTGFGLAPIFPSTVAALSRAVPPRIAAGLIAAGGLGGATLPWIVGGASTWCGDARCGQRVLLAACVALTVLHAVRIGRTGGPLRSI